MKKLFILSIVAFSFIACGGKESKNKDESAVVLSPEEQLIADGKKLFNSNKAACFSCHQLDKKVIGPSVMEIAKIYREQNADMGAFFRKQAEPIVDPSQYNVMETNFAILKTMTDEELKSLEAYMMSVLD